MLPKTLLLGLGLALTPVNAWFRLACPGAISRERLDPIVSPGKVSGHTHIISGGSNFGAEYTHENLLASNCTSCTVNHPPIPSITKRQSNSTQIREDLSNYWTPQLYVEKRDGTFEAVPIRNDPLDTGYGMTVYYLYIAPPPFLKIVFNALS
jgi:hypothetical protein